MYDIIIIGAGPAGLTAGLYAGRFRLDTVILEKTCPGGQIILSASIENFPGFPEGIGTEELIEKFKTQVLAAGVQINTGEATEIIPVAERDKPSFIVKTLEASYEAKSIIIATGAEAKRLGVVGEDTYIGRGVSYCGTCDGPLYRDKDIVVVGGGDRAIEEAIFLSGYAKKVTVMHRRQELRASKILEEKVRANSTISLMFDSVIEGIVGGSRVEAVKVKNVKTGSVTNVACQGVFIFVGIRPNSDFLKNQLQKSEQGFIITDQAMQTSQAGIFACGDCRMKSLYQVINACGEGATAADSAHKYLTGK